MPTGAPPAPDQLMDALSNNLPLYLQMIDPTADGPADARALKIFSALNNLGVIAVRPILLAVSAAPDSLAGLEYVLRLVVRRIIVGNLGTGNIERRFVKPPKKVHDGGDWMSLETDLRDLNPPRQQFEDQAQRRSFNKGTLTFLRRSIVSREMTPPDEGTLHFIWTRQAQGWIGMSEEEGVILAIHSR